jgi:hypothetical protein
MDKETSDIFDTYFELYGSPGWKQFVSDLEESRDEFDQVLTCKDAKDLHQRQGHVMMINTILNMPTLMEQAFDQANEAESDA